MQPFLAWKLIADTLIGTEVHALAGVGGDSEFRSNHKEAAEFLTSGHLAYIWDAVMHEKQSLDLQRMGRQIK